MFHRDRNKFIIDYESSAGASYLVLSMDAELVILDYQIEMIANNPCEGILPVEMRQVNDKLVFYYTITSKTGLAHFMKRKKIDGSEFVGLLRSIIRVITESGRYLLYESSFIIDPDYIFINPATAEAALVYVPVKTADDVNDSFKAFISDLIMRIVDFEEDLYGSCIQKILGYLRKDGFILAEFDRFLLEEIKERPDPSVPTGAGSGGDSSPEPAPADKQPEIKYDNNPKTGKNYFIIAILVQILVLLITGLVLQMSSGLSLDDRITTTGGAFIILAAFDFLFLRRLTAKHDVKGKGLIMSKREIFSKYLERNVDGPKRRRLPEHPDTPVVQTSSYATEAFEAVSGLDTVMMDENAGMESPAYLKSARDDIVEKIVLNKPSFVIGRMREQADYVSQNGAVGKIHAELISREGKYFVRDLNSKNGTRINGERIGSNTDREIRNNDRVAFANSEYVFVCEPGGE